MMNPESGTGTSFDSGLLSELLEHGLLEQLEPTKAQRQLIKDLMIQRQLVKECLHEVKQGNQQRRDKLKVFERETQKAITLEFELYNSLSPEQRRIAYQLLKGRDIL